MRPCLNHQIINKFHNMTKEIKMIVNRYILISKKVTRRTIYAKTKKLVFYLVDVTRKEEYSKD